jgi:LacI family transcriptional regulator
VQVPRVFVENEIGAYTATRCLIDAGHERIAYIGGPTGLYSVEQRRAGYLRAMKEAGLAVRREHIAGGSFSSDFSRQATLEFLRTPEPPTAIFGSSDYIVIGVVQALKQAGISVPSGMSVVGFDDMPLTELFNPPLTSIRQPIEALGRQGFQALFSLLNDEQPPMLTLLPVQLIERESVAPPRKGGI